MDRHYRETLDQPVGALNEQTPREAAKTPKGRRMLVDWLKFIETNPENAGKSQAAKSGAASSTANATP